MEPAAKFQAFSHREICSKTAAAEFITLFFTTAALCIHTPKNDRAEQSSYSEVRMENQRPVISGRGHRAIDSAAKSCSLTQVRFSLGGDVDGDGVSRGHVMILSIT